MLEMKLFMSERLQVLVQVHKRGVERVEVCLGQELVSVQHNLVQCSRALKTRLMSVDMRSGQPLHSTSTSTLSHACRTHGSGIGATSPCPQGAAACTSLTHLGAQMCATRRLRVYHVKEGEVNLCTGAPQPVSCALLEAELPRPTWAMKE
jgi:hypothetical protein